MKEYIFTVKGMNCSMCESHINDAIYRLSGVKKVKSNRGKNQTVVTAENLDVEKVISAVRELGYDIEDGFSANEIEKKSFLQKLRGK